MEKDSGRYRYEPYPQITGATSNKQQITAGNSTLKRDHKNNGSAASGGGGGAQDASSSSSSSSMGCCSKCICFGGGGKKSKQKAYVQGFFTNLGICVLLFGYTLIGSVIFLAIEGGNNIQQQILATTSINQHFKRQMNTSLELKRKNDEARARTVENIWEITVSLNILYRDNWTRLAAQEITRFQDELVKSLAEEIAHQYPLQLQKPAPGKALPQAHDYEWTFAKAFLYSLTVLTTIGYGTVAPRTSLGKAVTMGYATLGIPLTLIYLSSVGSLLSRVARGVFSKALCCCLCSNCGYCCYDEKRMAEKERRMKKKRQQMELQQQLALQEPFYVRSNAYPNSNNSLHSPMKDSDSLSCVDSDSRTSMHGLSILAPVLLCLIMMFAYICLGAFALYRLEDWSLLDGFYFCFMSLTTIGFGGNVPGAEPFRKTDSNITIWFCSMYIMSGMALTAMCFNVIHDEIVHRLKHQEKNIRKVNSNSFTEDLNISDPYNLTS